MNQSIIELEGLTKKYGDFTAVDHLDLSIRKGEIFGLLGPNGAGKSTTILMMLGLTEPTAGRVKVCGIDSTIQPIDVKRRVGYLPDDVGFYDQMTGRENLLYTARLNRLSPQEAARRADTLLQRIGLHEAAAKKAGTYSRGMRQRLGLADVLIKNPEVIILDEPTLGIDPIGVRAFLDLIVSLSREEQITVLLSSHQLHQVQQVCDRVGIFVGGKLLAQGNVAELSKALFADKEPFLVEAGVDDDLPTTTIDRVKSRLLTLTGVTSVRVEKARIYTSGTSEVTAGVGRILVQEGVGLTYLNTKTYGLDDIYTKYFEGREEYGKTA